MKRPRPGTRTMQDAPTATTATPSQQISEETAQQTSERASQPAGRSVAPTALDWVLPLSVLRRSEVAIVGDKSADLGEILAAGVDVPSGFAVSTLAFAHFIEVAGLQPAIETAILPLQGASAGGSHPSPAAVEHASRQIQAAIQAASMPAKLAQSIRDAYVELCRDVPGSTGVDVPVVMRSSAVGGNRVMAHSDGQDAYLNVCGPEAVVERVKACWSSFYAPPALSNRAQDGFAQATVVAPGAAVLVQRMVPSDSAGVCSTQDPVSGDPARIVVECTWGLGGAIASGRVRPDRFVVDRKSLAILERHISRKTIEHVPRPHRAMTLEQAVHPSRQSAPSMTDEEVSRVAETAIRIEERVGRAQEIEFAIEFVRDMRRIRIVSARPVTGASRTPALDR